MKVKKYIVDTLPQAMGQIKTELGNDAMILHTKKIKTGGFFGFFGKEKIEVIAAVDNSTQQQIPKNQNQYNKATQNYSNANSFTTTSKETKTITPVPNSATSLTNSNQLTSEVGELKNLIIKLMMNDNEAGLSKSYKKELKEKYELLIKQGVSLELATSLIEKTVENIGEDADSFTIYNELEMQIMNILSEHSDAKEIQESTKIVHFVGPTGVGKTTTIAKLAAEKVLKQNKRIAFVTADTYRIGAVDQLKTYAEILNAPIEVVFSPQDTKKAIEKLQGYDLIFMDTAGRNYHNDMYISELNNILAKTNSTETFLVLSLTHKYEDMISILERFKKVNIDKILFTKFDETFSYGSILNILNDYPYSSSYITHGQSVPDDIELFDEQKIAKAILRG